MSPHAFWTYTREILGFRLGKEASGYPVRQAGPGALAPLIRQATRTGRLVLLGLGSGQAARELALGLPPGLELTVCELFPGQAAGADLSWLSPDGRAQLLADTSAAALAYLLAAAGLTPGRAALGLNPEISSHPARKAFQDLARLQAAMSPVQPGKGRFLSDLSLGAILHPDEPDLPGFFAALPRGAKELVIVWDAPEVPERLARSLPDLDMEVKHLAHPLEHDFAAQRNRMLSACQGRWVLYLDADERLDPELSGLLPGLVSQEACDFWAFPRLGLRPGGVRTGFGLWPDWQTRLFKRTAEAHFARAVHERLEGLAGPAGLVLGGHIRHLSDLLKDEASLARKHALFDQAGGGAARHRQNQEFPTLPESFFQGLTPEPSLWSWPANIRP